MDPIKLIDGKKLHAGMLVEAEKSIAGRGDGRISEANAKQILKHLENDPHGVGSDTIEHIKGVYKLTSGGKTALGVLTPPIHIIPKTRPTWTGTGTPGVVLVDDDIHFATLGVSSGEIWAAKWQVINGDKFYPGKAIASNYRDGISALFMPNGGKSYIFMTYNRAGSSSNETSIVVGRYFVDAGSSTYWEMELPSDAKSLGNINCISYGEVIYLSWGDSGGNVYLATVEFKKDKQDSKPEFTLLGRIKHPTLIGGAPTIIPCSWSGEEHIMIYYISPRANYKHETNFCAAYYNPITKEFSVPKVYNAGMLIHGGMTARNLTPSCIQLVSKFGSHSIRIIEIEHDKEPKFSSRIIDDLDAPFGKYTGTNFLGVGIDDYLFYFDDKNNINYYLMPGANQL